MIFSTFIYLIAAGLFVLMLPPIKYERTASLGIFVILAALFANYAAHALSGYSHTFVYPWIEYKDFLVTVDLSSNFYNYNFITPVFLVILLAAFSNIFYPFEGKRLRLAALMMLNLAAFILLICSQNTLQLLISSCALGVIGFYVVNDFEARQKYVYFNLLADMGMFTAFAILYGCLGTTSLADLARFKEADAYQNFVPLLLLFSVFIKSGLFLFQNMLLEWRNINFNRLALASFALVPITSLAILSKVSVVLQYSTLAGPLMLFFAVVSMFWGFFGALSQDNIRSKALYLNMMAFGFFFGLLSTVPGQIEDNYPFLLPAFYLINISLSLVNIAASNETEVSRMGGFIRTLKYSFLITLIIVFADIQILTNIIGPKNQYWVWTFLILQLLALAQIYREIYFTQIRADERVWALLHNSNIFSAAMMATFAAWLIYKTPADFVRTGCVFGAFVLFMMIAPFRNFSSFYENEELQSGEWLNRIYENLLIAPIKILGRILWLTVDFLFIERTILSSLSHFTEISVTFAKRLQSYGWLSYLLWGVGGLGLMLWLVMNGGLGE